MAHLPFEAPVEKAFDDVFFGAWLENPVAFGAFEGESLIGYVEGSPESWNNRFRISNLCVIDPSRRRSGLGTALMRVIEDAAEAFAPRMLVLETQSCNEAAIAFYRKNGFSVIGFDLYAYANDDPERHEVRIEKGKKLERPASSGAPDPFGKETGAAGQRAVEESWQVLACAGRKGKDRRADFIQAAAPGGSAPYADNGKEPVRLTLPVSEAGLDTVQVKGRRTRGSPRNIHRAQRAGRKGGAQGAVCI